MNKKINIAIMVDQLVLGGVQKIAVEEAVHMQKLGHKVTFVVLLKFKNQNMPYKQLSKVEIIFLSDYNPWPFKKAIFIPYFRFLTNLHIISPLFVNRYHFLKKFDFIISHGTTTCITASAISKKFKIPYFAFIWDPMIYILDKSYHTKPISMFSAIIKWLIKRYERSFLLSAAIIATSSQAHQKLIKNTYQLESRVIYPATGSHKKTSHSIGNLILGYSRWDSGKNLDLFLFLAQKIPRAKFKIAGRWTHLSEEKDFRNKIKALGLEKRVDLISQINQSELIKLAQESIAWVHPTYEAFSMAGLEMASLGLPIIMPLGSGVTELFINNKHGFFPKEKERKIFLEKINYLLDNPNIAAKMGQLAALRVKKLSWKKHSQGILKLLSDYQSQTKITCLTNAFVTNQSTGGGDQFLMELVRKLPSDFNLTIITPQAGFIHWQKAQIQNNSIRFLVLPTNRFENIDKAIPLFLAYLIRSIHTYFLLTKLSPFQMIYSATDFTPDVIPAFLYHQNHHKILWVGRFFHFIESPLKRQGSLWVNTGSYLLQQLSLKLLSEANMMMVDNPSLIKDLQNKGLDPSKIYLNPGGVDTNTISKIRRNKNYTSDGIFIGRLLPHKGIFDTIKVWSKVITVKPNAKLTIIGYGPPEVMEKLFDQVKRLGLQTNIIFTGYIHDRLTIFSYYRSSKFLLFLDHEAGFGLVVAEAMAAGLPVIAYNLPIFGNVYKKGFLTAPLGNSNKVVGYALDLLSNTNKRLELSKQAENQSLRFDWSYARKKFYQSLYYLVSKNS